MVTSNNMIECLQKHDKYSWALSLITERLSDCIKPDGVSSKSYQCYSVIEGQLVKDPHLHSANLKHLTNV